MKRQAETELEPQREKKKVHVSDSFGKLIIPTPSMAKLEAYFAGTITECPYYNGKTLQTKPNLIICYNCNVYLRWREMRLCWEDESVIRITR